MSLSVLHVVTSLKRGGAETVLLEALRSRRMRDVTSRVIQLVPGRSLEPQVEALGLPLDTLAPRGWRDATSIVPRLRRIIRAAGKPTIVHSWLYHADTAALLATRGLPDVRLVWGLHTTALGMRSGWGTTALLRRGLGVVSGIGPDGIVACATTTARVHTGLGYRADRIVTIPNGIAPSAGPVAVEEREELRRRIGAPVDAPLCGSVSRNHPDKDPELFVAVAAAVLPSVPGAHFVLCGRDFDTPAADRLRRLIRDAGLEARVHLLGQQPSGRQVIRALDVCLLTSRTEAMPLVVLEAMMEQIAVVATAVGDVPNMLCDADLVVPPGDVQAMARQVVRLLDDPTYRQRVATRLGATARASYTVDRMVDGYLALYEQVAATDADATAAAVPPNHVVT